MRTPARLVLMSAAFATGVVVSGPAIAGTVTNPNDARNWQGATVGTFAQLIHGSDTLATRTAITSAGLLDDGTFDPTGYVAGTLISSVNVSGAGRSLDSTGTGSFGYDFPGISVATGANSIDNLWVQVDNVVGHAVWDLGFQATKAAVFNTIDHGPLPQEAIESTVYLSNGGPGLPTTWTWTQAVTEKVWLEGFMSNLGIKWDGFTYAVGTGTSSTFRYATIIWGGPGGLQADGDNEINGIMGLRADLHGVSSVPLPPAALMGLGLLGGLGAVSSLRRRRQAALA